VEYEARLAIGSIEARQNRESGRSQLRSLAQEAKAKGYLRIAQEALAAEGGN